MQIQKIKNNSLEITNFVLELNTKSKEKKVQRYFKTQLLIQTLTGLTYGTTQTLTGLMYGTTQTHNVFLTGLTDRNVCVTYGEI